MAENTPKVPDGFYPAGLRGGIATNFVDAAKDSSRPTLGAPLKQNIAPTDRETIVVVGGGYTGLSTALHLAEKTNMRVILLDAGRIGGGPSGKSAGHVGGLQASDDEVMKHCGPVLGPQLLEAAEHGPTLVKNLINKHNIPCDVRDGYVVINSSGTQNVYKGGGEFGIDPYPFVLGLARAAKKAGVAFHEYTPVLSIETDAKSATVITAGGNITADYVVAAGGHRMAENISALGHLRNLTTELRVTTMITNPIPQKIIDKLIPGAKGARFPFCNDKADVAYGSIDRQRRIVFGAHATAFRNPDEKKIRESLFKMFPTLADDYKRETGRDLAVHNFVSAEKLSYTAEALPLVGQAGEGGRILHISGLGGHGIAAGVMLGEAAADKIEGLVRRDPSRGHVFDQFASVEHAWLPKMEPFRAATAEVGLRLVQWQRSGGVKAVIQNALQKLKRGAPTP